jgi:hypothetical protein
MRRRLVEVLALACSGILVGCNSAAHPTAVPLQLSCTNSSTIALTNYDQMSTTYLDDTTRHPINNLSGGVAWNTRYYLESLITAYETTANTKYIQAFMDTGTWVMNLVQTTRVLNVPDPTAPGATGPTISVTGWPTLVNSYGTPVSIPNATGNVSLYAQSLSTGNAIAYLQVTQQTDGSLQLAWLDPNANVVQSNTVTTVADLTALAAQPLVWGQSVGRIILTGTGLPAVGRYQVNASFEATVWHEQTGGILLPFVQFLLLAKENPEIADSSTVQLWTGKVQSIAASYENEFVSDGAGGLRFINPQWLPNALAGTDSAADYIFAEASFRLFLYELTSDPHQLALARGLTLHQQTFHWQLNSFGWLELRFWPCIISWSSHANAPAGNIWDVFQFDPTDPAPAEDASFVADFLKVASQYNLLAQLGITTSFDAQQATFMKFMVGGSDMPFAGPHGIMRSSYPIATSTPKEQMWYSADPWAPSAWAPPQFSSPNFTNAYWNWMLEYGQSPQNYPVGYFLRAWARSESAQMSACAAAST